MSRREYFKEENRIKKTATIFSIVLAITIVAFGFMFNVYNKKLRESARQSLLELGSINAVVPNQISTENLTLEPASATQDKGINQVANEVVAEAEKKSVQKHDKESIENKMATETAQNTDNEMSESEKSESQNSSEGTNDGYIAPVPENYEPNFIAPVSGEIIKDFAADSLVYSKTLDEWTTHFGIDIRSEKMSVVVASEAGTVESIKNDPRYRTNNYGISSRWI